VFVGEVVGAYQELQASIDKWLGEGVTEFGRIGDALAKAAEKYKDVEAENAQSAAGTTNYEPPTSSHPTRPGPGRNLPV